MIYIYTHIYTLYIYTEEQIVSIHSYFCYIFYYCYIVRHKINVTKFHEVVILLGIKQYVTIYFMF